MDRDLFHRANNIYNNIKKIEEQRSKLLNLKYELVEILKGHTEIPEEEIYEIRRKIDKLSEYLDRDIDERYKKLDKL